MPQSILNPITYVALSLATVTPFAMAWLSADDAVPSEIFQLSLWLVAAAWLTAGAQWISERNQRQVKKMGDQLRREMAQKIECLEMRIAELQQAQLAQQLRGQRNGNVHPFESKRR